MSLLINLLNEVRTGGSNDWYCWPCSYHNFRYFDGWWPLSSLLLNVIPYFLVAGILALFLWGFGDRVKLKAGFVKTKTSLYTNQSQRT